MSRRSGSESSTTSFATVITQTGARRATKVLRKAQDAAVARAGKRANPQAFPGGIAARAQAELDLAEVLRGRRDAHTDPAIADRIVGAETCGRALLAAAKADPTVK
jgi:hypothetical protein